MIVAAEEVDGEAATMEVSEFMRESGARPVGATVIAVAADVVELSEVRSAVFLLMLSRKKERFVEPSLSDGMADPCLTTREETSLFFLLFALRVLTAVEAVEAARELPLLVTGCNKPREAKKPLSLCVLLADVEPDAVAVSSPWAVFAPDCCEDAALACRCNRCSVSESACN